ncbi:MAG: FGGY-family carbohydrate kinase [Woeseiaceae bacterium]
MIDGFTIVVDVGKTNAKVSLWDASGGQIARNSRANQAGQGPEYRALDVAGIEAFVLESLSEFAGTEDVRRIITVGHGAGAALLRDDQLFALPMDYEESATDSEREAYRTQRDPFTETGSPFLPLGLNLGMQLHRLETILGPLPEDVTIVPWAQYWAWRLCGVTASEISSLGCHTDLWRPMENNYSRLANKRGWSARMAPLRSAGTALGPITPDVAAATGLPGNCKVHCGLHDSNAALLAARGHHEIAEDDATILSTGTWFIAMRSLAAGAKFETELLQESRDCLINVDVYGNAVPSARFMGGRESELVGGIDSYALTDNYDPDAIIDRLPEQIATGSRVLPTFVKGVGPFPDENGTWVNKPDDADGRRAVTGLYLALMVDATLELIGSRDRLLIEGRFAEAEVFVRALATIRPQQRIYVSNAHNDVAYGALRLICPEIESPSELTPVIPLDIDLSQYAEQWRSRKQ